LGLPLSAVTTQTSPLEATSIASTHESAIRPGSPAGASAVAVVNEQPPSRLTRRPVYVVANRVPCGDPVLGIEGAGVADVLLADPAERAAVVVADQEAERARDIDRVVVAGLEVDAVGERRAAVAERERRAQHEDGEREPAHGTTIAIRPQAACGVPRGGCPGAAASSLVGAQVSRMKQKFTDATVRQVSNRCQAFPEAHVDRFFLLAPAMACWRGAPSCARPTPRRVWRRRAC
jgi:hypothetical protein